MIDNFLLLIDVCDYYHFLAALIICL